ncbi:MAG: hypothetical protein IJU68_03825 [Bacteroidales bacterium]|nr:hypothetical protein [Bacteroidales bacterium]
MKKFIVSITGLLIILGCASSCLFISPVDIDILTGKYYISPFEPYYRVEYTIDGERVEYVQENVGSFNTGLSKDGNSEVSFRGGYAELWLEVIGNTSEFETGIPYKATTLNIRNKYMHLCGIVENSGTVYFKIGGEKSYDVYQVLFKGDCIDPDTGHTYTIRDGVITVCKNTMPRDWKDISNYLKQR